MHNGAFPLACLGKTRVDPWKTKKQMKRDITAFSMPTEAQRLFNTLKSITSAETTQLTHRIKRYTNILFK